MKKRDSRHEMFQKNGNNIGNSFRKEYRKQQMSIQKGIIYTPKRFLVQIHRQNALNSLHKTSAYFEMYSAIES